MNRNILKVAAVTPFAILCLSVALTHAQGVITVVEDFEGELPGAQPYPGGYSYAGGGNGEPTHIEEVTETGGFNSLQAFQVSLDATVDAGTYFYYGFGGFFGFYGEGFGFAQGQAGANDPKNYAISFDYKVVGNDGNDAATPIGGSFAAYDADYETAHDIDLNNDLDKTDGFDIWRSEYKVVSASADYTHVTWRLDQGTAPTADALIGTPQFSDETTFAFQIFFNSGGFGTDAGNVVTIDNLRLTFTPPVAVPGDFNNDTIVDGADFLAWQRGESPTPLSGADLDVWKANFGGASTVSVAAIPEPTAVLLAGSALGTLTLLGRRRSSQRKTT